MRCNNGIYYQASSHFYKEKFIYAHQNNCLLHYQYCSTMKPQVSLWSSRFLYWSTTKKKDLLWAASLDRNKTTILNWQKKSMKLFLFRNLGFIEKSNNLFYLEAGIGPRSHNWNCGKSVCFLLCFEHWRFYKLLHVFT